MNTIKLDSRLGLAASLVGGKKIADVGTDHGYIPIYLMQCGSVDFALCTDINEGPLDNARKNAEAFGITENIEFCLCDGLTGVDLSDIDTVFICGMGGELIARIIEGGAGIKNARLVLQPMSAIEDLRRYLSEHGYKICDGGIAEDKGKLYQCFAAEYTGQTYRLSAAEALVGRSDENIRRHPLFASLVEKYMKKTRHAIDGRRLGGLDTAELEELYNELSDMR